MSNASQQKITKVGIAGLGAIGGTVARALMAGIPGYELIGACEIKPAPAFNIPIMDFEQLSEKADLIVEALPPAAVPALAQVILKRGKDMILISSASLLMFPEILETHKSSKSRIIVPPGALVGIDGIKALALLGIRSAKITSTKPPRGFAGAPYIREKNIDLAAIKQKTRLFAGNAREAAKAFPANVNVAATLSLAGIGPDKTQVEVWADPQTTTNSHEISVDGEFSRISARIENEPDPANPKSSLLAAQSIIAALKDLNGALVIL